MKKFIMAGILSSILISTSQAQEKLTEQEIADVAKAMETDWRYGVSHVLWLEDEGRLTYYLQTASGRCLDDLTTVVELAERSHIECHRILQVEKQIYAKPGSKKSEASLARYFTDTEKARQRFAAAKEAEQMYKRLLRETAPIIESKSKQTFKAPEGELTKFYFRQGGGMVHMPARQAILNRQKDGTYTVQLDTRDFDRLDTLVVTQAQVDTIRQMLIEGEVYKMPRYYDTPMLLLDGPSSSVEVCFTDATFSCGSFPPSDWGGRNIWKVYHYLKDLQPKQEATPNE